MTNDPTTTSLTALLAERALKVIDLTQPLSERTPVIRLPEPMAPVPRFKLTETCHYDEPGGFVSRLNKLEVGEHVGTHFDAPIHWITGQNGRDVSEVPARHLVAPAVVIDRSAECAEDPDFLLSIDDVRQHEAEHGPMPDGSWLLFRTGWDARAHDEELFLNADDTGHPRTPGLDAQCARWIAEHPGLIGLGVETVGTDAGRAGELDPPFPAHSLILGANKYGLTQLANLERLPPTGAVIVAAPLKIVGGTGSPARVLALVPRGV